MLMRRQSTKASGSEYGPSLDPRLPLALTLALGFAITMAAAAVLTAVRTHVALGLALGVMTVTVLVLAWWSTVGGAVLSAGLGWLMLNGFVINQYGALSWHGNSDVINLAVLVGVAVLTAVVRSVQLSLHPSRHRP